MVGELAELEILVGAMGNAYAFRGIYPNHPGRLYDVVFPCGLLNSELTYRVIGLALI
jgi:hypothetical protein